MAGGFGKGACVVGLWDWSPGDLVCGADGGDWSAGLSVGVCVIVCCCVSGVGFLPSELVRILNLIGSLDEKCNGLSSLTQCIVAAAAAAAGDWLG